MGKWRLVVTADRPILVMNLLANTGGRLGNLSTSSLWDNAPGSHAAFGSRFAGKMLAYTVDGETGTLDVLEGGRFTDTLEVGGVSSADAGGYGYQRTGLNAGRLTLTYDDGDECLDNLYFTSTTAGWFTSGCTGEEPSGGNWRVVSPGEAMPSFGAAAIGAQTYEAGTAIGPLALPEASGGDGALTYSLLPGVPGLVFDAAARLLTGTPTSAGTYSMTYTVTDEDGDTDMRNFTITVNEGGGDSETRYGVGDVITTLPTGTWFPDLSRGGVSFRISGGSPAINFANGGYIEEGSHRYTCEAVGGCAVRGREVTAGTIVETPKQNG